jgi:hypothetical protein
MSEDVNGTAEHDVDAAIRWLKAKGHTANQTGDGPKRYEVNGKSNLTEYQVMDIYRAESATKAPRP